jgi:dTDP-4-amino-4,6-dideoxygalactose transaminase
MELKKPFSGFNPCVSGTRRPIQLMDYRIPFNKPFIVGDELTYIEMAVSHGHISGDGPFTKKCQELLEKNTGAQKVLLTHSCTAALEMAAILLDIEPGDEVILPSFTFVSTANAFYLRGARLVFVDIRPDTLNIDETKIERSITEKTKAIVVVHYCGVACAMTPIMEMARHHGLHVVEDAAQAVDGVYENRALGTVGTVGAFSFHETKNYICGEGGAIVINNPALVERAEIIREKGTNRSKFFKGEVDKYTWVDIGSSYLPSDILAAFLFAQLQKMDLIRDRSIEIFNNYQILLSPLAEAGWFTLPYRNHHSFYLLLNNENERNALMAFLKTHRILSVFHYLPLHLSPVGKSMGYGENDFPITENTSKRLLRLPFYFDISDSEQDFVADRIKAFFEA